MSDEKNGLDVTVRLNFDAATWGQLRRFVALGKDIPDENEVGLHISEQDDLLGFEAHLDPNSLK